MDLDHEHDRSPFDRLLGLRLEEASGERVVALLPVTADLLQNAGVVHGGVYATAVEATASTGADLCGELRVEATPLERGHATQLWQAAITDEGGRMVAHGRVLLQNLREA